MGESRLTRDAKFFLKENRNMENKNQCQEEPRILDEIQVEELAIDGICGVY
jgi:mycofactocin precursor